MRYKTKWLEMGEKNSKYFYTLEKYKCSKRNIIRIKDDQNKIISNQKRVDQHLINFLQDLYKSDNIQLKQDYLAELTEAPRLSERDKVFLEVLDLDELELAIKQMKSQKAPGTDGLVVEFFRTFWPDIKIVLYNTYQEAIANKQFHISARRGIISLIEKIDRDPLRVENWRPLTLMNVDYKVLCKSVSK